MKPWLLIRKPVLISMATNIALIRLLQLVSPGLPIGMYSYSQGMERAVDDKWLVNEQDCYEWLSGILHYAQTPTDAAYLSRLHAAWSQRDSAAVQYWSSELIACRESQELRDEDRQTGQALARLLVNLEMPEAQPWLRHPDATLAGLFSLAAVKWGLNCQDTLSAYLWGWLENQVLSAVKLVPLGQVAGQQLLYRLATEIPASVEQALALSDQNLGGSAWGQVVASGRHEMQYSRLFRS